MERKTYTDQYKAKVERYLSLVKVVKGGLSWRDLARLMGQSPQNFHQKIKRGSLDATELFQLADVLGASVRFVDKKTGKILI